VKVLAVFLAALLACGFAAPSAAQDSLPPAPFAYRQLDDPAAEAEARALMHTLRCVTCQGQSIADSDAAMAGDMRHEVRSRIAAGQSGDEVRAWLVERYGEYISYEPSIGRLTWPLYAIPFFIALLAGLVVWRRIARTPAGHA
jgi:cytochrome c-type biogenesis protein CcmH